MSGGAYNYLCYKDFLSVPWNDLEEMAKRLEGLDYAEDAARETRRLMQLLADLSGAFEDMSAIWKAVEWWDSGDWGEEEVEGELEKWRDENARGGEK